MVPLRPDGKIPSRAKTYWGKVELEGLDWSSGYLRKFSESFYFPRRTVILDTEFGIPVFSVFCYIGYTKISRCCWRPLKLALMHNRERYYSKYDVYFMSFCTIFVTINMRFQHFMLNTAGQQLFFIYIEIY